MLMPAYGASSFGMPPGGIGEIGQQLNAGAHLTDMGSPLDNSAHWISSTSSVTVTKPNTPRPASNAFQVSERQALRLLPGPAPFVIQMLHSVLGDDAQISIDTIDEAWATLAPHCEIHQFKKLILTRSVTRQWMTPTFCRRPERNTSKCCTSCVVITHFSRVPPHHRVV